MPIKIKDFGILPKKKPVDEGKPSLGESLGETDELAQVIRARWPDMPLKDAIEMVMSQPNLRQEIEESISARKRIESKEKPSPEDLIEEERRAILEEEEEISPRAPSSFVHDLGEVLGEESPEYVSYSEEKGKDVPVKPGKGRERSPGVEFKQRYPGVPSSFQLEGMASVMKTIKTASGWNSPFLPGRFFESRSSLLKSAWKDFPEYFGRKPPKPHGPGKGFSNRYCGHCGETTRHEILEGGKERCSKCHRIKIPKGASSSRVVVRVSGFQS